MRPLELHHDAVGIQHGSVGINEFEPDDPIPFRVVDSRDHHVKTLLELNLNRRFLLFGVVDVQFAEEDLRAVEIDAFDDMRLISFDAKFERRRLGRRNVEVAKNVDPGVGCGSAEFCDIEVVGVGAVLGLVLGNSDDAVEIRRPREVRGRLDDDVVADSSGTSVRERLFSGDRRRGFAGVVIASSFGKSSSEEKGSFRSKSPER